MLADALRQTVKMTGMVFFVVIGASVFSYTFRSLGGDELIFDLMEAAGLGAWGMLFLVLGVIFALGFIIDWIEIALITLPIFFPILSGLDFWRCFWVKRADDGLDRRSDRDQSTNVIFDATFRVCVIFPQRRVAATDNPCGYL